jgi:type I restriction enzyme S subunit
VDKNFGWHLLNYWIKELKTVSQGSTFEAVGKNEISSLVVSDVPFSEQLQIAHILDTVDEAIQRTEQLIAKLKAIKQGLLHDLLTRGLDENGQLRDPIAHPEQFKDSPLGRIPKGWKVSIVSDFGEVVTGTTPSIRLQNTWGDYLPFITPAEITEDGNVISPERYLSINGAKVTRLIPANSVLTVCIGSIGKIAITNRQCATNQQINAIIPRYKHDSHFIYGVLSIFKESLFKIAGLQVVPIVNKNMFSNILIPIAPYKEQKKIGDIIRRMANQINCEQIYLSKLKLLKKVLMHDLLTGKVRVNINTEEFGHEDINDS